MNKIIKYVLVFNLILIHFISNARAADQVFFYHTDPVGTPMAISDANGQVVWRGDYKPFGEEASVSGALANDRKFVGKEKDEETGLYYFGARYLDAKIGRFAAVDPVRAVDPNTSKENDKHLIDPQILNLYAYSSNNPTRWLDPDGKEKVDLFPPHEKIFHNRIRQYKDIKGVWLVYTHGNPYFIYDSRNGNNIKLTTKGIAKMLKSYGWNPGDPVVFFSCRGGQGNNSIAEQFAKKYHSEVWAADKYVSYNEKPNSIGPTWVFGRDENGNRNFKDPGKYRQFK